MSTIDVSFAVDTPKGPQFIGTRDVYESRQIPSVGDFYTVGGDDQDPYAETWIMKVNMRYWVTSTYIIIYGSETVAPFYPQSAP